MTLQEAIAEHLLVVSSVRALEPEINTAADRIALALRAGSKLMLCGNGGSAADCQHLAAEFVGRFSVDRAPLAAIALTTDSSVLTAVANDWDNDEIFARQIYALGKPGDVLLAISTSGNSVNVRRAVVAARAQRVFSVGLLGRDGGAVAMQCDLAIVVSSQSTARIQEAHLLIEHVLCGQVERALGLA